MDNNCRRLALLGTFFRSKSGKALRWLHASKARRVLSAHRDVGNFCVKFLRKKIGSLCLVGLLCPFAWLSFRPVFLGKGDCFVSANISRVSETFRAHAEAPCGRCSPQKQETRTEATSVLTR
ncbi:putative transmembrane protein [Toxoplasma gondii p89]|uniref:Putative transmembrane protein n=1 Tax=Toxoplasma gondii p89 TaxID=943119 RepID=A0A086JHB5_TOXGO|nr:putative transmembrane protein [Toxoplasma gondii p89]